MFSAMPELLTLTMEFSVERFSQACEPNLKGLYSCVVVLCYMWIAMKFFSVHYGCMRHASIKGLLLKYSAGMTIEARGQTAGQVEKKTWEEKKAVCPFQKR